MKRIWAATRDIIYGIIEMLIGSMPGGLGRRLRYAYYKRRLKFLGKGVSIEIGVRIINPHYVSIGDNCWVDNYVIIIAGPLQGQGRIIHRPADMTLDVKEGNVEIGENVHLAPYVLLQGHGGISIGNDLTIASGAKIYSLSHHYQDLSGLGDPHTIWKFTGLVPGREQALICAPVVIEDNAAVGLNSVILPGSFIGKNSWLGAMSLLHGELPPNVIAVGLPASIIKQRTS